MAEVAMGTLYDVNKSAMEGLSALSRNQIKRALTDKVGKYVKDTDNTYYMLLCNETRDYTVFRLSELDNLSAMLKEMQLCLSDRGEIYSIDKDKNGAIEIWVRGTGFMPLIENEKFYCSSHMIVRYYNFKEMNKDEENYCFN